MIATSVSNDQGSDMTANIAGSMLQSALMMRGNTPGMVISVTPRVPRPLIGYLDQVLTRYGAREATIQALSRHDLNGLAHILQNADPRPLIGWRGTTLLHLAAAQRADAIKFLIDFGYRVNSVNENGTTPLHIACEEKCDEACGILIRHGANPNAQDMFGNTPMMRGVMAGNRSAISVMTSLGANPFIMNYTGMTPQEMEEELNKSRFWSVVHHILTTPKHAINQCRQRWRLDESSNYRSVEDAAMTASAAGQAESEMPVAVPILTEAEPALTPELEEQQPVLQAETIPLRTPSALRARGLIMPPLFASFLLLLLLGWIIFCIVCTAQDSCEDMDIGVKLGVMALLYVIHIIEALYHGNKYLRSCINSDRAYVKCNSSLGVNAPLRMEIACYHWQTIRESYTDKDGKTHYRTRQEKRYTHRASQHYSFDEFWMERDSFLPFSGICLVSFSTEYQLADPVTIELFEKEKSVFIALNNRDMHYEFTVVDEYPTPEGFVALDGLASVRLINFTTYVILSLLMLSVPYRVWLNSVSSKQKINMKRYLWKA